MKWHLSNMNVTDWTNKDNNKQSNVPMREIIEMILSNPHKRAKQH